MERSLGLIGKGPDKSGSLSILSKLKPQIL